MRLTSGAQGDEADRFRNVYEDLDRASAYAGLGFPGTYYLAFRDLPALLERHVTGTRALDFGCGAGRSSRFLRDRGFDVVGVDISPAMLAHARELDPSGDYRLVREGDLGSVAGETFDLVLSTFTFDNIPSPEAKETSLIALRALLADDGRMVNVVSAPEIYVHEWASFSTRDFPANRKAKSGERVRIVMLDVADRRPVEDVVCFEADYRRLYARAGMSVRELLRPLATGEEPVEWRSETEVSPWAIYVLEAARP